MGFSCDLPGVSERLFFQPTTSAMHVVPHCGFVVVDLSGYPCHVQTCRNPAARRLGGSLVHPQDGPASLAIAPGIRVLPEQPDDGSVAFQRQTHFHLRANPLSAARRPWRSWTTPAAHAEDHGLRGSLGFLALPVTYAHLLKLRLEVPASDVELSS